MLNEQTLEFGQAKLKAKNALRFSSRKIGKRLGYIVEDELTGKFFQIGLSQYTFLSLLTGRRTVNEALERTATLLRKHAFDQQEVASLCKWAIESGLLETEIGTTEQSRERMATDQAMQKATSWLNPITLKIPLASPDGFITAANRVLGWLVSPFGAFLWLAMVCYGFGLLLIHSDRFFSGSLTSFSANDVLWFAVAWLLLKLVHEMAHGLVCKSFGGRVSSCGMLLLLMIPLPYVDVTSSWSFANKWQRILTSAAGMLCEIFVAAIACVVWVNANPGPIQYHASNVIVAATLHTLIFNANPLMRFDGYYILSDFVEIPNLATHGRAYVKGFFKWLYFGTKQKPVEEVGLRALVVRAYGFGTIFWFFMISIGLSMAASGLLEGIGLMIALVGIFLWFVMPVFKFGKYVMLGSKFEQPNRKWFAVAASITCLIAGTFLFACPSPSVVSAPVVIDYKPGGIIVAEGDLLVTLENQDLEAEYASLRVDIEISKLRIKSLLSGGEIALVQLEEESLLSNEKRLADLEILLANLEVRATQAGQVIAADFESKLGTYFHPGDELLIVGDRDSIQATALVKQEDIRWVNTDSELRVEILVWGDGNKEVVAGTLVRSNPRARDDLPHEAFAASNGGPLAVVPREQVEGDNSSEDAPLMLTEPRVPIEIALEPDDQQRMMAGQSGLLMLRGRQEVMAGYLADRMIRFARKNNFRTHGL